MNKTVRPASLNDYKAVESLWLELNAHHVSGEPELMQFVEVYQALESYEQVVSDPKQEILILCERSEVVGAVWLAERLHEGGQAIEMPVAFIQEFCTKEAERRHGCGRALMAAVEEWAKERRLARIEFNVWAGNKNAISFYEELGFDYTRHEMYKKLD